MAKRNEKRPEKKYVVEKTVETLKILEVLDYEPISIEAVINRVGSIPGLEGKRKSENNGKLKPDCVRRILVTLKLLGYATSVDGNWRTGHKTILLKNSHI